MDETDLCLSIDLGSGGPKVAIVTFAGDVVCHEVHHVATNFAEDGAATQDPEEWWAITAGASRRLIGSLPFAARVQAIAVTGMYACTVPVDANGHPSGPCLTWLDTRGGAYAARGL